MDKFLSEILGGRFLNFFLNECLVRFFQGYQEESLEKTLKKFIKTILNFSKKEESLKKLQPESLKEFQVESHGGSFSIFFFAVILVETLNVS